MSAPAPYSEAQWRWIAERYREGYSQVRLARLLGLHRETLRRRFQRMGVLPEDRGDLPELDREEFDKLKEADDGG